MSLKILCIDDSRSVHAFMRECLKGHASELKSAFNGQEALDILKDQPNHFDVIFLDWEMPILTGPETFFKMKELQITTPVIMVTSKNAEADIMQMLEAGVAEYVMKPFTQDIILEKITMVKG